MHRSQLVPGTAEVRFTPPASPTTQPSLLCIARSSCREPQKYASPHQLHPPHSPCPVATCAAPLATSCRRTMHLPHLSAACSAHTQRLGRRRTRRCASPPRLIHSPVLCRACLRHTCTAPMPDSTAVLRKRLMAVCCLTSNLIDRRYRSPPQLDSLRSPPASARRCPPMRTASIAALQPFPHSCEVNLRRRAVERPSGRLLVGQPHRSLVHQPPTLRSRPARASLATLPKCVVAVSKRAPRLQRLSGGRRVDG